MRDRSQAVPDGPLTIPGGVRDGARGAAETAETGGRISSPSCTSPRLRVRHPLLGGIVRCSEGLPITPRGRICQFSPDSLIDFLVFQDDDFMRRRAMQAAHTSP